MSWSLEKETALRRLTATGVPYHEAMRRVEADIPAEQEKVQRDLERAQASVDHLGDVLGRDA